MGLADLKWIRGAAESRNGDGSDVDDSKADSLHQSNAGDPASIGQALLDLVALVVAELKRRDEDLSKASESVAADNPPDGATVVTDKETREPERSKKN